MFNKYVVVFSLSLAAGIGCSSDDGFKGDGGTIRLDNGLSLADGSSSAIDSGQIADTTPAQLDCAGIFACLQSCGQDTACQQACVSQGTPDAQSKFQAVLTCQQGAVGTGGACATDCQDTSSTACTSCLNQACKSETDTCLGGGGPAEDGFGDKCSPTEACKTGFECIGVTQTAGICTKACTNQGRLCPGSATGEAAACVLAVQTQQGGPTTYYCAFLCEASGQTFTCPADLQCAAAEDPPGSGQKGCEPKP